MLTKLFYLRIGCCACLALAGLFTPNVFGHPSRNKMASPSRGWWSTRS
jgi:hypothetical protein